MLKPLKVFICLSSVFLVSVECDQTLRSIFMVVRHGDRAPVRTYPTDPYKSESFYPQGFGRLTTGGKQRLYNVGRWLRQEYGRFLSDDAHEVYARSSGKERCLESAELLLNGAYKPTPDSIWAWNSSELWIPVPVQTVNASYDLMLNMFAVIGAGQAEFDAVYSSAMVSDANRRWTGLYKSLANWTGQEHSFRDFQDADYIYDTLVHQKMLIEHFEFPSWATKEVRNQLEEMHRLKFGIFTANDQIKRLTMGVFLNELTEKIGKAIMPTPKREHYEDTDDTGEVKKLNVYLTHDIFLFNLLLDLNIPNTEIPPFGSAIIFELYTDPTAKSNREKSSMVRIRYLNENLSKNYTEFKANPLRLFGSLSNLNQENYTVKEFLSSFSGLLISQDEADRACRGNGLSSLTTYIVLIVVESIVILLGVMLFVWKCMNR